MITICKHQVYPHCAILEGLPYKHSVFQSTVVRRSRHCSENGVSSCQYLQASQTALLPVSQRARKCCSVCDS